MKNAYLDEVAAFLVAGGCRFLRRVNYCRSSNTICTNSGYFKMQLKTLLAASAVQVQAITVLRFGCSQISIERLDPYVEHDESLCHC